MSETAPELFDSKTYVKDKRYLIPELLGRQANQFLGTSRFVHIDLADGPVETYTPVDDESEGDFRSPGYGEDSDFKFNGWVPSDFYKEDGKSHFQAYLVGFPRLILDDDKPRDCLHIWGNNSDIFAYNFAIHLGAISGLFVYSELRTRLQIDLDELAFGDVASRYEIPLLRNKKTGEEYYRDASFEDIERIIEEIDEKPTRVVSDFASGNLNDFKIAPDSHLKSLLDQ